jgi:hypothetical protein
MACWFAGDTVGAIDRCNRKLTYRAPKFLVLQRAELVSSLNSYASNFIAHQTGLQKTDYAIRVIRVVMCAHSDIDCGDARREGKFFGEILAPTTAIYEHRPSPFVQIECVSLPNRNGDELSHASFLFYGCHQFALASRDSAS